MNFVGGPVAKRAVPPVIAAVTADVLTLTAGALGGICRRTAPLVRSSSRDPCLKLKTVFAPSRVIVRSVKVSSARDSTPVRTPIPWMTLSFTAAGAARHEFPALAHPESPEIRAPAATGLRQQGALRQRAKTGRLVRSKRFAQKIFSYWRSLR